MSNPPTIVPCCWPHDRPPRTGDYTPWGCIDSVREEADGVYFVNTPSHGGLWLSLERAATLPDDYQPFTRNRQWHEEDVDAFMIACYFDLPDADAERCDSLAEQLRGRSAENWQCLRAAKEVPTAS